MLTDKTGVPVTVSENADARRYEVFPDGQLAGFAEYRDRPVERGTERIFTHTEVAQEFGGRGLATILVREALDDARTRNLTIIAVCPMVADFLKKNPAYAEASRPVTPAVLEFVRSE